MKLKHVTKFSKEIRKLRIDANMTLEIIAEKCDLSVSHIAAIEVGKRNMNESILNKLLSIFKLNKSEKDNLKILAYESNSFLKIDLSTLPPELKHLAAAFCVRLKHLESVKIALIEENLTEYYLVDLD